MKIQIITPERTLNFSIPYWLLFNKLGLHLSHSVMHKSQFEFSLSKQELKQIFVVLRQVRKTHPGKFIEIKGADGEEITIEL